MLYRYVGLLRISEIVKAYAYLILSLQSSARSNIIENTVSTLAAQKAFLNNFENVVNHRADIREDITSHQETLSYALSKVDYSMRESIYMLPSDTHLNIRLGITTKFLYPMVRLACRENDMVNTSVAKKSSHRAPVVHSNKISIVHALSKHTLTIMYEIILVVVLT